MAVKINTKVEMESPGQIADRILKNPKLGLFLATTWAKELDPYVPMDVGSLYTNKTIEPFKIIYNEPYAHYQWVGVSRFTGVPLHHSKDKHQLATKKWNEACQKEKGDKVAKEVSEFIKRM